MAKELSSKEDILICQCNSPEHQMFIRYWTDDKPEEKEVYASVHLTMFPWYKRIWHAIKYVFGHRSIYGDFDEFIFRPEDYQKIQDIADYLKEN